MTISTLLLTGAAGRLGTVLRERLRGRFDLLRLSDVRPMAPAGAGEEVVLCDLADAGAVERLCEGVAIIAGGKVPYAGSVDAARDRIPAQVRLETERGEGAWRAALPADARNEGRYWLFSLPESGIEPLLRALIEGDAGILSLSIERAGLHDAFVDIAGEAAARALDEASPVEQAR